jgi:hypothetical protein
MSEDVKGLPDVPGLAAFVADSMPQENVQTPQPEKAAVAATPQPQVTPEIKTQEPDWAQFKNKDGSLNHEALLKSYKEIQGAYTKTTQENKAFQENLLKIQQQVQEQQEIARLSAIPRQAPPAEDFDSKFIQDPKAAVEGVVEQRVASRMLQAQIESVLAEEAGREPDTFQERYSLAMQIRNQFPQLTQTAMGVKKLFQMAENVRKENLIKQSHRAVQMIFGDDIDIDKLRTMAKKTPGNVNPNLAYMPDTSSSSRSGSESGVPLGHDAEIQSSAAKGDVDSVITALFKKAGVR